MVQYCIAVPAQDAEYLYNVHTNNSFYLFVFPRVYFILPSLLKIQTQHEANVSCKPLHDPYIVCIWVATLADWKLRERWQYSQKKRLFKAPMAMRTLFKKSASRTPVNRNSKY